MYDVKSPMGTYFNGVEIPMMLIYTHGNLIELCKTRYDVNTHL